MKSTKSKIENRQITLTVKSSKIRNNVVRKSINKNVNYKSLNTLLKSLNKNEHPIKTFSYLKNKNLTKILNKCSFILKGIFSSYTKIIFI